MNFRGYKLSLYEAMDKIDQYDNMTDEDFDDKIRQWATFDVPDTEYDSVYKSIRDAVVNEFKHTLNDNNNEVSYALDLAVGIKLFEQLNPENGFDMIVANDDDVWRYISVKVMPDLTFVRYPNNSNYVETISKYIPNYSNPRVRYEKGSIRLSKKRFYSQTRRIWLKTLWWYIYLGWQGTPEKTYSVLKNNGVNTIGHFIERTGEGYRLSLYRRMMYAYSLLPEQKDSVFRAAAKLNLAKCVSVEPSLTEGGEEKYCENLFREVYKEGGYDDGSEEDDIE